MDKLKVLEEKFYDHYPTGFDCEEMRNIEKKHELDKFLEQTHEKFSVEAFQSTDVIESFYRVINASTLVSRFEKPAFKNFMSIISDAETELLKEGLFEFLHGDEEKGFNIMVEVMTVHKVAKWPILTVLRAYYYPQEDLVIKPTTVKKILKYFDVTDIHYTSKPNYQFYADYRIFINNLKKKASKGVKSNNPAFSGFLMMMIED
ncbi:MAG: hypothetical protein JEZ08_06560 [Clostridiales bacterium]|nr:hypothetical protein [Clostridiales bacterium]